MALLPNGYNPQTLEDVLGQQAQSQSANLTDQYQQQRKRSVAQEAANGRLLSGVSTYPLTDLDTSYQRGLSGIQTNLSNALSAVPEEDWLNQNNFQRSYQLASLIGSLNKPSTLDEVLGGIGQIGPLAATAASFL